MLIDNKHEKKQFNFDKIFDDQDDQQKIYEQIGQKLLNFCLDGYNSSIFAYGQTGKNYPSSNFRYR